MLEFTKTILGYIFFAGIILTAIFLLVEALLPQIRRILGQLRDIRRDRER